MQLDISDIVAIEEMCYEIGWTLGKGLSEQFFHKDNPFTRAVVNAAIDSYDMFDKDIYYDGTIKLLVRKIFVYIFGYLEEFKKEFEDETDRIDCIIRRLYGSFLN